MPRLALGWRREALVPIPIEGDPVRHVKTALLARTYHSPAVQAMSEIVRRAITEGVRDFGPHDPAAIWRSHGHFEPDVPAGSGVRAMRLLVVRGFARYMEGVDPQTEVPPAGLIPSRQRRRAPFIYSDADILALMAQAQRVIREPLRAATCETLIGLFAVHGLRTRSRLDLQSRSRQRSPSSSDRRRPADAAVRISTRITGPRRRSAVAAPRRVCRVGSRETTSLGIDEMTASSSSSVRNWMSGSASRCRRRFGRAARDTGSMVAQPLSIASEKDARGTSSRS